MGFVGGAPSMAAGGPPGGRRRRRRPRAGARPRWSRSSPCARCRRRAAACRPEPRRRVVARGARPPRDRGPPATGPARAAGRAARGGRGRRYPSAAPARAASEPTSRGCRTLGITTTPAGERTHDGRQRASTASIPSSSQSGASASGDEPGDLVDLRPRGVVGERDGATAGGSDLEARSGPSSGRSAASPMPAVHILRGSSSVSRAAQPLARGGRRLGAGPGAETCRQRARAHRAASAALALRGGVVERATQDARRGSRRPARSCA